MRLRRLDLTRYGKFTDHRIDFGASAPGAPDLHVVYGPNEAGKSTAFAAFLDLLYGIGGQSPYGFLHPYATMRIGGLMEFADGAQEFVRIKRPQGSLLDGAERPIAESAIRGELGGIEREAYRTMFSLDDETLEKGGESILASKGDLGELLFSAGAGLSDLSRKLVDLRGEADRFYKYRARTGTLADLKGRLAELKREREGFDTLAADYGRLIEARDRIAAQYDGAITERAQVQARIETIQRQLNALPRFAALRMGRERLAPLADLPDAPAGWAEALPVIEKEEVELGVRQQTVADAIARLTSAAEAVAVDAVALGLSDALEELADLKARDRTAERDLPVRQLQLREADLAISGILGRLERPNETDPARLVLGASTIGRLRSLIEARSGVDAALRSATTEASEARRTLAEAEDALHRAGGEAGAPGRDPMAALAATLAGVRGVDHGARRRQAARTEAAASARLDDRMRALAPWSGAADDLPGLRCPAPATLRAWSADLERHQAEAGRHAGEIERLTSEVRRLTAERDVIADTTGLVGDQAAAAVRGRREQAWARHRRDLDAASGDAFEAVLREDDLVTGRRLEYAAERATLHQNARALALARESLARATELDAASMSALAGVREAIANAVRAMAPTLDASMPLTEIERWLDLRDAALEAREVFVAARTERAAAEADGEAARDRLRGALDAAGASCDPAAGLDALLVTAQAMLDRDAAIGASRERVEAGRRAVDQRERALAQGRQGEEDWAAAWTEACAGSWLGEDGRAPELAAMREILVAESELGKALEAKASLADRSQKMEKDRQDFRSGIVALAEKLKIPAAAETTFDLDRQVGHRIRDAIARRDRRAQIDADIETERVAARALAEALAIHGRRKAAMTAHFGVGSLAEVSDRLSKLARRADLRAQAEGTEREIVDGLGAAGIAESEGILEAADRPALEAELAGLRARHQDLDTRCQELFASRGQAIDRVEAIGGDSRVAAIEERRRTTLLEIEEGAARYLQLRAGTVATELGLRVYRERHRSAMMARASAAFRTISRGAYTGLAAQPGKDGETLIALPAAGGAKEAQTLSKGTRFQLYLALRVAGYHEFTRARAAVPFIADDIMETFDDFRAEEAFRLFADMAGAGQVIYLTHHRHLCEIALRACPSARVHDLQADRTVGAGAA